MLSDVGAACGEQGSARMSSHIDASTRSLRDVTPIRVRGKKRPRGATRSDEDMNTGHKKAKSDSTLREDSISTRHSRRAETTSALMTRLRTVTQQHARKHQPTQLSLLELLPAELLEEVLLKSVNVNLARASPFIASKLSHRATYTAFCTAIFGYFWTTKFPYHLDRTDEQHREEQLHIRGLEEALQTRWMTWSFFNDFRQAFYKRFQTGIYGDLPKCIIANAHELNNEHPIISFRVPPKLLREPLAGDRLTFLAALVAGNAKVDWINTTLGETAEAMWRAAIKEGRFPVVSLMMRLGVAVGSEENPLRYVVSVNNDLSMIMFVWAHAKLLGKFTAHYHDVLLADPLVQTAIKRRCAEDSWTADTWSRSAMEGRALLAAASYLRKWPPEDEGWKHWYGD